MAQVSRSAWATALTTLINDNTSGEITPADVRSILTDLEDSVRWYDEAPLFLSYPKLANETRVNESNYVIDADMVSDTLEVNSMYRVEMMFLMTGDTAQDLRFRMGRTGLSDATLRFTGDLDGTPSTNNLTWGTNTTFNLAGTANRYANYIGVLITGANPGTIHVEWGQAVSGAPAAVTTMRAGSMMLLRKVA